MFLTGHTFEQIPQPLHSESVQKFSAISLDVGFTILRCINNNKPKITVLLAAKYYIKTFNYCSLMSHYYI